MVYLRVREYYNAWFTRLSEPCQGTPDYYQCLYRNGESLRIVAQLTIEYARPDAHAVQHFTRIITMLREAGWRI